MRPLINDLRAMGLSVSLTGATSKGTMGHGRACPFSRGFV